jgi:hypothetical protein
MHTFGRRSVTNSCRGYTKPRNCLELAQISASITSGFTGPWILCLRVRAIRQSNRTNTARGAWVDKITIVSVGVAIEDVLSANDDSKHALESTKYHCFMSSGAACVYRRMAPGVERHHESGMSPLQPWHCVSVKTRIRPRYPLWW